MSIDLGRWLKGLSWTFLWVLFFWTFLVIGLPTEAAKGWLAERLGHDFDAKVSVEELAIGWNLSFTDISSKEFSAATLPVPSSATMSGSGRLKFRQWDDRH